MKKFLTETQDHSVGWGSCNKRHLEFCCEQSEEIIAVLLCFTLLYKRRLEELEARRRPRMVGLRSSLSARKARSALEPLQLALSGIGVTYST